MPHAFRCRNCGQLVPSGHAGECAMPRSCPVCKAGVMFNPNGTQTDQPENWEVLADAAPDRLAELGLTVTDVAKHTPTPKEHNIRAGLETIKEGIIHHEARRAHWAVNKDTITAEFQQLDARYLELGKQLDAATTSANIARLSDERDRVYQRMRELADLEPSARDAAHEAHLKAKQHEHEAYLASRGTQAPPQTLRVRAWDGATTQDRS